MLTLGVGIGKNLTIRYVSRYFGHDTIRITISRYCNINKDENTSTCICTSDDIDQRTNWVKTISFKTASHLLIPMKFAGSNILFVQLIVLAISLNFEAKVLPNVNFKLWRRCWLAIHFANTSATLSLLQKYTCRTAESLFGDISI